MNPATVEFRHVSKQYGAQQGAAVVDLSLRVPAGDICVLVGPSGCGKTTSLKMVNRLVEPSSGQVLIDDRDVMQIDLTELRRGIGYVIQQIGLFPHQTIAENVGTVPRLLGWPKARIQRRTEELLDLVGLDPALVRNRYPAQLSGGERQRVGVARAMAAEPPVMLMDEPFGAVDPIVRERLQNEFLRLHRTQGTTVLFVTHDIDEAIKMGSRVAVMQQGGHLAQYAPPTELLAHPASDFVSRFVGTDRGLKRLSLLRVADVRLESGVVARVGESLQSARRHALEGETSWVLLLDRSDAPLGWVKASELVGDGTLSAESLDASSPLVHLETTLRDALAMLLTSAVQTAVVVDEHGHFSGMLTFDELGHAFRTDPEPEAVAVL
ncbi:MAG: ABC transporter ATP-binding protein [Chloroflexi bacterium]|nr:ABC transporter ATP-binding protein [Chloroflexota bacterium]MBV9598677.1 ABC transporter ATP-binding protein [Chloroflexota bacterium]